VESHTPWPTALHGELAEELRKVTRRKLDLQDGQLETSAFSILWILSDGKPRTLRELADELSLEQSTVNRQVNSAIRHGYLERFEVDDSISRMIRPTERGEAAFEHDGLQRAERLNTVFAELPHATLDALVWSLREFNDAYDGVLERQKRNPRDRRTTA
jgi:DNA-binding MarR family transcriptional regulator